MDKRLGYNQSSTRPSLRLMSDNFLEQQSNVDEYGNKVKHPSTTSSRLPSTTSSRLPSTTSSRLPSTTSSSKELRQNYKKLINEILNHHYDQPPVINLDNGSELDLKFMINNKFKQLILIKNNKQLGFNIASDFNLEFINQKIGKMSVEAINSITQSRQQMILSHLIDLFSKENRKDIFNLLSLEISECGLNNYLNLPTIVQQISWSYNSTLNYDYQPRISKYLLLSMKGCWTDFHTDFGGTSVFYHVIEGSKTFFIIEPTEQNLAKYEKWFKKGSKGWFGDEVDNVYQIKIVKGNTIFMPAGYIHGVYTHEDTIAYGGNFFNFFNVKIQIHINNLDNANYKSKKFKIDNFELIHLGALSSCVDFIHHVKSNKMLAHYKDELNAYTNYCIDYLYPILDKNLVLEKEKEDYDNYKNILDKILSMLEENEISDDDDDVFRANCSIGSLGEDQGLGDHENNNEAEDEDEDEDENNNEAEDEDEDEDENNNEAEDEDEDEDENNNVVQKEIWIDFDEDDEDEAEEKLSKIRLGKKQTFTKSWLKKNPTATYLSIYISRYYEFSRDPSKTIGKQPSMTCKAFREELPKRINFLPITFDDSLIGAILLASLPGVSHERLTKNGSKVAYYVYIKKIL